MERAIVMNNEKELSNDIFTKFTHFVQIICFFHP
jgi:hypothetical protein